MDIKKLQRAIVDGLEDLKGQNIAVFDTEHLSSLFERVVIASGTSNRQTRALASSVREAVKEKGFPVPRVEGEENGEWIIVDCGAAVVHLMQQTIRDYYNLEEIWGDKPVKLKAEAGGTKLVKASESVADERPAAPAKKATAKKAAAGKAAPKKSAEPASGRKAVALAGPTKKAAAKKAPAKKAAVKKAPVQKVSKTEVLEKPKSAAKKPAAKKGAVSRTVGVKAAVPAKKAAAKAPAAKKAASAKPAAKSAAKKTVAKKATRSA